MCGRYYIPEPDDDADFREIMKHVHQVYGDTPALSGIKSGEILPASIVPVVTQSEPVLMKWGFSRYDGKGLVINARLETASEKPMFKNAFRNARCLVPASHYFEWRKDGAHKIKYAIGRDAPIYMAGLYRREPDAPLPLFVILTRPAASGISFIHDRMPVVIPEAVRHQWLANDMKTSELMDLSDGNLTYRDAG